MCTQSQNFTFYKRFLKDITECEFLQLNQKKNHTHALPNHESRLLISEKLPFLMAQRVLTTKARARLFKHFVSSAFLDQTYPLFIALSFSPRR